MGGDYRADLSSGWVELGSNLAYLLSQLIDIESFLRIELPTSLDKDFPDLVSKIQ